MPAEATPSVAAAAQMAELALMLAIARPQAVEEVETRAGGQHQAGRKRPPTATRSRRKHQLHTIAAQKAQGHRCPIP